MATISNASYSALVEQETRRMTGSVCIEMMTHLGGKPESSLHQETDMAEDAETGFQSPTRTELAWPGKRTQVEHIAEAIRAALPEAYSPSQRI